MSHNGAFVRGATTMTLQGIVRNGTIVLEQPHHLPDGTRVEVVVTPGVTERVSSNARLPPGEGIRRSAGAWADDPEGLDEYLQQLRDEREQDRPPIEP
jgi:hypothetical protein